MTDKRFEDADEEAIEEAARRVGACAEDAAASALALSNLGLKRLPESLRTLVGLTELDLSDNLLTELPEWLGELSSLEVLVLRRNQLLELPAFLSRLSDLTRLDAGANRLLRVAPQLVVAPRLTSVELDGNPHLLQPPPEIVSEGGGAVVNYLRGLDSEGSMDLGTTMSTDLPLTELPFTDTSDPDAGAPAYPGVERSSRHWLLVTTGAAIAVGAAAAIATVIAHAGTAAPVTSALRSGQSNSVTVRSDLGGLGGGLGGDFSQAPHSPAATTVTPAPSVSKSSHDPAGAAPVSGQVVQNPPPATTSGGGSNPGPPANQPPANQPPATSKPVAAPAGGGGSSSGGSSTGGSGGGSSSSTTGGSGGGSSSSTTGGSGGSSGGSGGSTCAVAWNISLAYVAGDVVSYNGDNWTANQWNDDEVPGGPAGAWNDNGPC